MMDVRNVPRRHHRMSAVRRWRIMAALLICWILALAAAAGLFAASLSRPAAAPKAAAAEITAPRTVRCRTETQTADRPDAAANRQAAGASEAEEANREAWLRTDIPLGIAEQRMLHAAAAEYGIPYTLALAVVEQETQYRNIRGDGGASIGYMQIQPRWWAGLMADIGASDLSAPEDNFRTGCAILAQLIAGSGGDVGEALSRYNTGRGGTSPYSASVLAIAARLEG